MGESHSDILTGIAAAGSFIGGILAAIGLKRKPEIQAGPENGGGMAELLQRIAVLENRADECDARENERHHWHSEVFGRLLDLDKKTSAILAILDERRHER